jgi:hypothetical protein
MLAVDRGTTCFKALWFHAFRLEAHHHTSLLENSCRLNLDHASWYASVQRRDNPTRELVEGSERPGLTLRPWPPHQLHRTRQDGMYAVVRLNRLARKPVWATITATAGTISLAFLCVSESDQRPHRRPKSIGSLPGSRRLLARSHENTTASASAALGSLFSRFRNCLEWS